MRRSPLIVSAVLALLCTCMSPFAAAAAPLVVSSAGTQSANVAAACPQATPGTAECLALRRTDVAVRPAADVSPMTAPSGYGPSDLQSAYALPSGTLGAGRTVAVVDAYDLPTAESDLGVYRAQYGLPACTTANGCFRKVDQTGHTSYPAADSGWGTEIALDTDMVSAICPSCKILLVEANDSSFTNLGTAVNTAVSLGAVAVSNSYSGPEFSGESSYDTYYNHPGVAVTVSTGDCGYNCQPSGHSYVAAVGYPSASSAVIAVGGTTLTRNTSARGWTESAWGNAYGGAGSGCSLYESKPSWQHDAGCAKRSQSDVSAVADPGTGVAVYDSYPSGGWAVYGGTSASSPIIAATFALAGVPSAGTNPASYLYGDTADLYDVVGGNNNITGQTCTVTYLCNAVAGYDGPTGLGTPNGVQAFAAPTVPGKPTNLVATAGDTTVGLSWTAPSTGGRPITGYTVTETQAGLGVVTCSMTGATACTAGGLTDGTQYKFTVCATNIIGNGPASDPSNTVTPTAPAATHFVLSGLASPSVAGVSESITVTAKDGLGNTATGYTGTVHFTSSDAAAVLPANYTFTGADSGGHVFGSGVQLKTAGTQSVTATDTVTPTITGAQTGIVVQPGAAIHLAVTGLPSPYGLGVAHNFTVTALDAFGNTATGYLGTVHFTSSDPAAQLPSNYTFVAGDSGIHTFSATLNTAGTQSVTATDTVTPTITGAQTGIVVTTYTLSGTFTAGGVAQTGGSVYLFMGSTYTYLGSSPVDVSGHYSFGNLPPGSYKLYLAPVSPGFGVQWYGGTDFASATTIVVSSNTTANIALVATVYTLSGSFTAGGVAQTGGSVYLFMGSTYSYVGSSAVDGSGNYSFGNVPAGSYKLYLAPVSAGFGMQWYGGTDFASATTIVVSSNTTANIALAGIDTLSGNFTAAGTPQSGGAVYAFMASTYSYVGSSAVDGSGNYSFSLPAGSYKLYLSPVSAGFGMQWYGGMDFASATTIVVSSNTTVNIALVGLYTLSGNFTAGGTPQSGGTVYAFLASTYSYVGSSAVDVSGNYAFSLPSGSYKLFLSPSSSSFGTQWYGGTDFASATTFVVSSNTTVNIAI